MSDIKHTASLEVIIYGKKNVEQLTSALEQAAIEFENIKDDADAAAKATKHFGDQQIQVSKLVIRNAKDAAKAIHLINAEQQRSLIGASKSQIAARKKRFAEFQLAMPQGTSPSTRKAAEARVAHLAEGKTKSSADLGRSFSEIKKQAAQAKLLVDQQIAKDAKFRKELTKRYGAEAVKTKEDEFRRTVDPASQANVNDIILNYTERALANEKKFNDLKNEHKQKLLREQQEAFAAEQAAAASQIKEAEKGLKALQAAVGQQQKINQQKAAAEAKIAAAEAKRAEKAAAAEYERKVKAKQEFQAQYERPVGKRHSERRMAELKKDLDDFFSTDGSNAETPILQLEKKAEEYKKKAEEYEKHLSDKLFGQNQKALSEADNELKKLQAATKRAIAQQKQKEATLEKFLRERDKETERFYTSLVPRQLQPFFRRGGLFMQKQYNFKAAPTGIFGGIRGAVGGGGQYGEGGYGGPSGPMRVIAYDALRRVLTETYSIVSKIAGTFKDWIIEGVKFNDELVRAKTFFTSLGLIGMKGASGQEITVAEASTSSNVKIKQAYEKSSVAAEEMMNRMMAVSALTGQDLGEIVSSARQSMTDLLNKVNKTSGGKTSAFLENPKMFGDVAERMVKLAAVLRMADPQNRKLGFHMVGLQELFSGSTGGKKDSGLQNVLSILRREGIQIEQGVATQITKMVSKGNITGAMDLVEDALSRAGLGMVQLENMLNSTLQPAIDGAIMYAKIFNRIFTKALYENSLKPFFRSLLKTSDLIFRNKDKMAVLEKMGATFARSLDPIFLRLTQLLDFVQGGYSDPAAMAYVNNTISTVSGIMDVILAFSEVMIAFVAGIMGGADSSGLQQLSAWIRSYTESLFGLGQTIRRTIEYVQSIDASFFNIIKTFAIVVSIVAIIAGVFSSIGAIVLGIVTPMLGLVWSLSKLRAILPFVGKAFSAFMETLAIRAAAQGVAAATGGAMAQGAVAATGSAMTQGAVAGSTAVAASRVGLLARAAPAVAAIGTGLIATVEAVIAAINWPIVLGALAVIAAAGAAYWAYSPYNQRETSAEVPTENKKTVMRNVQPKVATVNKSTVNNNNPTINVTVTGVSGPPQQIGASVASNIYDTFKSVFNPIPDA